jgi:hypothetical protein
MAIMWRYPLQPVESAAGTAVTAAALTSGLGGLPVPQLPPIGVAGAHLSLKCTGEVTSTSATPTVILGFYIGSVGQAIGSKTVIAVSGALAINVAATAWPFIMHWDGTIRTLSPSAGVINGQGYVKQNFGAAGGLATAFVDVPIPITAALRTVSTLNNDQTNELDVGITLSSVTGTPSVTITNFWAELSG